MGKVTAYRPETISEQLVATATGATQTVNSAVPQGTYYASVTVNASLSSGTSAPTLKLYPLTPSGTALTATPFSMYAINSATFTTAITLAVDATLTVATAGQYKLAAMTTTVISADSGPLTFSGIQLVVNNGSAVSGDTLEVDLIASRIG